MNKMAHQLDATLQQILDLARWAPSGDNTQPWRFEVLDQRRLVVHGHDTRDHCVYDLDGHPSQMSIGALLETMAIAASTFALEMRSMRHTDTPDNRPTLSIEFLPSPSLPADPLADAIMTRSVQRRALSRRALTATEKSALTSALPDGYRVRWLEGGERLAAARLMFGNAKLRLTMPEAHRVHASIIEWNARYSEDRIPDQALGADAMTTRLMRWVMQDWKRVQFFNTWLAGTLAPRLQMDLIPALACAAHFVLVAERKPQRMDDYIAAGRAMQRFWLTATAQGLQLQPELTPLIFSRYVREERVFSATPGMQQRAERLSRQGAALLGQADWEAAVFMGRIGAGEAAQSRSLRRPLRDLLLPAQ
ncbi:MULTISPECIES: nitroreductase family protein [unclassified Duganella]|uniref:nitroreductase family protein n=1 Tax=unclassified Duganella TaxID=2636909 RepID=UPI0008848FD7|nr:MULTISPECIES: nitroreductase family protein [unclassified Duganella]SDH42484.1 Nitroreductase family protein [Duganella sp. OV458]SDK59953.1 Nitroreductase family protein [Duganella sp. OV510]